MGRGPTKLKHYFHFSDCTKTSCTPTVGEIDPNLFKEFKRSLTWDISVPERTVLSLDIAGEKLKARSPSDKCLDDYHYSVSTTKSDGQVSAKSFCRGGTLSHMELLGVTTVTVEVPAGADLDTTIFSAKAAPRSKFLTPQSHLMDL